MQQQRRNPLPRRRAPLGRRNNNRAPRNGPTRAANGASHFDGNVQNRTIMWNTTLAVNNTKDGMAFGIGNVNLKFDSTQPFLYEWMDNQSRSYEQFKIRRIRAYVMPGTNMTNDIRIKSKCLARVDTDNFVPGSTATTLGYLMASSNTVSKMLPDARQVLVADWNPTCKPFLQGASTDNGRQLPNALSYMAIRDTNGNPQYQNYEWRGLQMALITPDDSSFSASSYPSLSVRVRIDVQFRGRVSTNTVFSSQSITQPNDIPTPDPFDLTGSFDEIRNSLLTGAYVPIGPNWNTVNIANIGTDLTIDLTGAVFRDSTQELYTILEWSNSTLSWGANST